jgi:hypothetical protein
MRIKVRLAGNQRGYPYSNISKNIKVPGLNADYKVKPRDYKVLNRSIGCADYRVKGRWDS